MGNSVKPIPTDLEELQKIISSYDDTVFKFARGIMGTTQQIICNVYRFGNDFR